VTALATQASAEAADFDPRPVWILFAAGAVAVPAVGEVEALGGLVAEQDPEDGLAEARLFEAAARLLE
jgi:hypothetical protein